MQGGTNAYGGRSAKYQRVAATISVPSASDTYITDCRLTMPKGTNMVSIWAECKTNWPNAGPFVLGLQHTASNGSGKGWFQQDSAVIPHDVSRLECSYILISDGTSWVEPRVWQASGATIDIRFEVVTALLGGGRKLISRILSFFGRCRR